MLDAQFRAELVELMFPALCALAQAKETVGELLPVVREYGSDAKWACPLQIPQKAARVGRCLTAVDADKNPARSPVNCNKQITAGSLILHLRQILHVDVDIPGVVCLEPAVLGPCHLCFQIAQIARAMPSQTPIQP